MVMMAAGAMSKAAASADQGAAGKSNLWIGAATADITPDRPVPLTGFTSVRIARSILSRCTANVLALESRDGDRMLDQAILISCDLCVIRPGIQEGFRKHMAGRLSGFDLEKLFLAATHTHTAPVIQQDRYDEKDYADAMQPKEYVPWMYEQMAQAVTKAWEGRAAGAVAWGLGEAVVGCNRRASYADGSAKMYGNSNEPAFRHIEGYEDHAVCVLGFYNAQKQLQAAAITLACPAQMEGGNKLSADFWHDARQYIRKRHGDHLCILGFCAPAGDQAPNLLYRKAAEARMDRLRGLTRTQELGRRIANAFDEVVPFLAADIRTEVPLVHQVKQIEIPARIVTEAEYLVAKKVCDGIDAKSQRSTSDVWVRNNYKLIADRYLAQQQGELKTYPVEMHVLRLGDVAIATNPFELYLDYGVQMQARSPATQTMLIQLASTGQRQAYYVPTPRAVAAGSLTDQPFHNYSATVMSNIVGPEGAQVLVDRTVEAIEGLWGKTAKK